MIGPFSSPPARANRLLVVFSDIEMGAGGVEDDFPHSDFLGELILAYNEPPFADLAVDLVFNGDTFDLLKTAYLGEHPRIITAGRAVGKMTQVASAHPRFFEAVRLFLDHRRARRQVYFVTGNHDAELAFLEVQQLVAGLCGGGGGIEFPGLELRLGRVHLEHGAQLDPLFRVDPARPFLEIDGEPVLNISWGAAALLDTVMQYRSLLSFHDRVRPKEATLELMPELKELLVGAMWRYWTHDYWKDWLRRSDPTRRLTWTMVKELLYRFSSNDIDVSMGSALQKNLKQNAEVKLWMVGHQHDAGWWTYLDRKILQTGCLRNEYVLEPGGERVRPVPKSYAEAFLCDDEPVTSHLRELVGPPPPAGYVPESIFGVLPEVRRLLGSAAERQQAAAAREAQEHREAGNGKRSFWDFGRR
jgi:UDP-2,3-diacylglucosamine pyrophosphatase LpxH